MDQNEEATPELTVEESNAARLQALQVLGVGINGINEALMMRMLEALLGTHQTVIVKQAHQEWLAEQLGGAEAQIEQMRQRQILLGGKGFN